MIGIQDGIQDVGHNKNKISINKDVIDKGENKVLKAVNMPDKVSCYDTNGDTYN